MHKSIRRSGIAAACAGAFFAAMAAAPAQAADDSKAVTLSGGLVVDIIGLAQSGKSLPVRELDKLTLSLGVDFEKAFGWKGGTGVLTFQNTSGSTPNDLVGTLEGIDNNEAPSRRARLYEAWVQQAFANDRGSLKLGVMDLNTEFYVNPSAGLLIAPQFGIGSEFAATGPGGPSIFPQTALAARLELKPSKNSYVRLGLFNAHAGDIGDRGGLDTSFDEGVLEVAEGGWEADGKGKLVFGGWRYSKKQDDLFDVDRARNPIQRNSNGAYVLAERVLRDGGDKGATLTGFIRAGISDGNTGPFNGSWQAGALIARPIASRPDSQISFAVDQAYLGDKFRAASKAGGAPLGSNETHFELTYSDKLIPHLNVQPDVQYVVHPGGDTSAPGAWVFMLRLAAGF